MGTGLVPNVIAVLLAAVVMILGGCLTADQAYRSISWSSVVLIGSMIPSRFSKFFAAMHYPVADPG